MFILFISFFYSFFFFFFFLSFLASSFDRALCDIPTQAYLAARVEIGRPIAKVIYAMEGDGPMIFIAFDLISYMRDCLGKFAGGQMELAEETRRHIQLLCPTQELEKKLIRGVVVPALNYMNNQLDVKHVEAWTFISHVAAFCPWNATQERLKLLVGHLKSLQLVSVNEFEMLMKEVPVLADLAKGNYPLIILSFQFYSSSRFPKACY